MDRNLLNSSIYYSPDGGTTWDWHTVTDLDMVTYHNEHQWDYGPAVAVDPSDATGNTVYIAGVDIYYSTDGAVSWQNVTNVYGSNPYGVHPDQHAIAFFGGTSPYFYFGNDGGVWNCTTTCHDLNAGLNITQFYGGGIGTTGSYAQLYGGTQDNGTDQYPTGAPTGLAQWNQVQGGDGGNTVVDYTNNAIVYGEVAGDPTIIKKSTDGGATWNPVTNGIDLSQSTITQNFVPPLVMSPSNHNVMFTGTDYLYKSTDGAATWAKTSSTTVDDNKLSAIAVFPGSDSDIYVGDNHGLVSVSTDGGATWSPRPFNIPTTGGMVTGVAVDPLDPSIIYATVANFATCSSCGEHVFRAINATDPNTFKWTDISTSLPNAPFESILVSTFDNNTIFAGSDVGVFESTDAGANWMNLFGLPKVAIDQMFTDPGGGTLYVATHGRGMWKVPLTTGHVYETGGSCVNSAGGSVPCMYSLNASDASTVWQVPWSGLFNGPSPVYANGVLYGLWALNGVFVEALDASTGAQLWQSQLLTGPGSGFTGIAVANGAVYVGFGQTAFAFNTSSGALFWSHQIGANLGQGIRPAADANGVYYGAADGKEYAFSVSTGAQLWSHSINSTKGQAPSPSTAANGLIYVSSNDTSDKNVLYALNASTGRVSYSMSLGADNVDPTPLVGNGLLYIKTLRGWLYAIKPDLSAIVWSWQNETGGPALDGNKIFILANSNIYGAYLYALDATTGNLLWGPVGNGQLANSAYAQPAAAGGVVSVLSSGYTCPLPAFAEATGHLLWQWTPPGSCPSSNPLVAG